ncbi:MAG: hypothetical protein JXI43_12890 [Tissierellales bacterium]|nr:hypothetical protein [Tissierellales bacterium]
MRLLFCIFTIMLGFLLINDVNADEINLSDIYKDIVFVTGIPNHHGRAKEANGINQYNIPIGLNVLNIDNIKKSLYLIGTDQPDNEIEFSHFDKNSDRYENYQVAVYKSKSGQPLKYKLISTKNDQYLKDRFYKVTYIKDGPIKEQINGMVKDVFGFRYGFELDKKTQATCGNKPGEIHQLFERGEDKIYFYHSICTKYYGDGVEGKELIAIFRKNRDEKPYLIWKTTRDEGWVWSGGSYYVTKYVGDLDNDNNIEVFLRREKGVSAEMFLVEIEKGKETIIYKVRSDSEGESETYPTERYDKLLEMNKN